MRVVMEFASQLFRIHSGDMVFGVLAGFPGLITASSALTQLGETLVLAALASQKLCKRNGGKATFPVALCPLISSHSNSHPLLFVLLLPHNTRHFLLSLYCI
jgi:hypothetical protein